MNTGCGFSAFRFCTEQNLTVHNNRVAVSKIKGYSRCKFTLKYLRTKTWEAREFWLNCFGSFICFVLFLPWRIDVSKLGCSVRQKRRLNQLRPRCFTFVWNQKVGHFLLNGVDAFGHRGASGRPLSRQKVFTLRSALRPPCYTLLGYTLLLRPPCYTLLLTQEALHCLVILRPSSVTILQTCSKARQVCGIGMV